MKLSELRENPNNPSVCTDEELERLAGKLKRVPLGLTAMRIAYVTDDAGGGKMVISGNKRLRVLKQAYGEDGELPDEYFQDVTAMSEAERHEFIVSANVSDGEWDLDRLLEQYGKNELKDLMGEDKLDDLLKGLEAKPDPMEKYTNGEVEQGSLVDRFGIPPFSILDTRKGYWLDRKRLWLEKTGDLTQTKENVLSAEGSIVGNYTGGSSNFDPVLAELMFRWFAPKGGKILDPFGGEQTKGVVAGELGLAYTAVEFRKEQVEVNTEATKQYPNVKYYTGDSNLISEIVKERDFDFVFTSPPYYDLEVYSKEDMSALGTYDEFMQQYENIFKQCVDMMADNRFMCVKIGEVRDKKTGVYRNFVGDNITIFKKLGLKYYNEMILINATGTAGLRANNCMGNRKVVKVHQNVLVFYKGDVAKIKDNFPLSDIADTFMNMEEDDEEG